MNEQKNFSRVLRAKRHENKHTQEKAAELLEISARHFQELESGRSLPGFRTICRIAKEYSIDFAEFAEAEDEKII